MIDVVVKKNSVSLSGFDSSCIFGVKYNFKKHDLTITFSSDTVYVYHSFPVEEFYEFITAKSKGKYFKDYIYIADYLFDRIV